MPCISKNRDRSCLAALGNSHEIGFGVGIPHGMDLAEPDELWKKTMQFDCFNPLNSPLGQP
jgi:hypothetical protein